MASTQLDTELRSELEAIAERHGCAVIHSNFSAGVLRLILDRAGGVTLTECTNVSRETSALLDVLDFGDGRYTLEVSSPGLDRELYQASDYERFKGNRIRVTWRDPTSGEKRSDVGVLTAYRAGDSDTIELDTDGKKLTIQLTEIIKARLKPEF